MPTHTFFADDSRQRRPTRPGMERRPLVAAGGILVDAGIVRTLEEQLDKLCEATGFPPGEEFKWSPARRSWMRGNLTGDRQKQFFADVLAVVAEGGARALVVVEDTRSTPATNPTIDSELDVVVMLLERIDSELRQLTSVGIVVADRPGGGRREGDKFLDGCLGTLRAGTAYASLERIALMVAEDSRRVHLLQVADVVTGCTTSAVAGETNFAPSVF